jgi:hypothetical protein
VERARQGPFDGIQTGDFVLARLVVVAAAVGFRRALRPAIGPGWATRLLAVYGLSLVAAGILRADPADGFPLGSPARPRHRELARSRAPGRRRDRDRVHRRHLFCAGTTAANRRTVWLGNVVAGVGIWFLVGYVGIAAASGSVGANLAFTAAVIAAWAWLPPSACTSTAPC